MTTRREPPASGRCNGRRAGDSDRRGAIRGWALGIAGAFLLGLGLSILNAAFPYLVAGAIFVWSGWQLIYPKEVTA